MVSKVNLVMDIVSKLLGRQTVIGVYIEDI